MSNSSFTIAGLWTLWRYVATGCTILVLYNYYTSQLLRKSLTQQHTTTATVLWPFVWDYPGELVPEETLTDTNSLLNTRENCATASSFLQPPMDSWGKGHCSPFNGSRMPVPSATQMHENKQPKTSTQNACPLNQPVTDCHAKYLVYHISFMHSLVYSTEAVQVTLVRRTVASSP